MGINDSLAGSYKPPLLSLTVDDSTNLDSLVGVPRNDMNPKEKDDMDKRTALEVYEQKRDPDMLSKVTPKAGEKFQPPAPTRVTAQEVDNAIKERDS